jgi:Holliday junction resolvasome RuvABC endonuclease subunit
MQRIVRRVDTYSSVLVADPSITAFGLAVVDFSSDILYTEVIKTEKLAKKLRIRVGDDDCRRISEINQRILQAIRNYKVRHIIGELPGGGSQSAVSAKALAEAKTILQTIADCLGIGIEWYSEGDSKKCLLGKTSATKQETIDAINKIYKVNWTGVKYKDEAIADALSIHYTATKKSSVLKLLKI